MPTRYTTCIICGRRPALPEEKYRCKQCQRLIAKFQGADNPRPKASRFITYRGYVIGAYPIADGQFRLRPEYVEAGTLPKKRTIDLNVWCDGFTRQTIKALKADVLSLHHAYAK